jgi:hypothetical protein
VKWTAANTTVVACITQQWPIAEFFSLMNMVGMKVQVLYCSNAENPKGKKFLKLYHPHDTIFYSKGRAFLSKY